MNRLTVFVLGIAVAGLALAQDYGGGWGAPSLDTASTIGQQVVASELGQAAAKPGRTSGPRTPVGPNGVDARTAATCRKKARITARAKPRQKANIYRACAMLGL